MAKRAPKGPRDPKGLDSRLEQLFCLVLEQVRSDPEFAAKLETVLTPPRPPAPKRHRAEIDPFALYDQGWEAMLRQRLARLDVEQLRDVVHQYGLDPQERSSELKTHEQLSEWIVKVVLERAEAH
jgi:hypothetical protein